MYCTYYSTSQLLSISNINWHIIYNYLNIKMLWYTCLCCLIFLVHDVWQFQVLIWILLQFFRCLEESFFTFSFWGWCLVKGSFHWLYSWYLLWHIHWPADVSLEYFNWNCQCIRYNKSHNCGVEMGVNFLVLLLTSMYILIIMLLIFIISNPWKNSYSSVLFLFLK